MSRKSGKRRKQLDQSSRDVTSFVREYFRTRQLEEAALNELANRPVPIQLRFFKRLSFASRRIFGSVFPDSWESMTRPSANHYIGGMAPAIQLAVTKFAYHAERLSSALAAQRTTEDSLLLGKYDKARTQLLDHQDEFGMSLWSIDVEFIRRQFLHGFHGVRTAFSVFTETCENDWIALLASVSSYRAQINVSAAEYCDSHSYLLLEEDKAFPTYAMDYLQYRILDIVPTSVESICHVLHFESRHSLLDQFFTFARIIASRSPSGLSSAEREALGFLLQVLDHPWVRNLCIMAMSEPKVAPVTHAPEDMLRTCADACLAADYEQALQLSVALLLEYPAEFCAYLFAATAAARGGSNVCPAVFPSNSPSHALLTTLYDWYSGCKDRKDSLETLRRLSRILRSTALGPGLLAFTKRIARTSGLLGNDYIAPIASPVPLAQLALAYEDPAAGLRYLALYESLYGESRGTELVGSYLEACCTSSTTLPFTSLDVGAATALLYRGAVYLRRGEYQQAVKALGDLRQLDVNSSVTHPEALFAEVTALVELREMERAARLAGTVYCEAPRLVLPALLDRFAELMRPMPFTGDTSNIAWPILATAAMRNDERALDLDRVHDFVGDFIESTGHIRPTELLDYCNLSDSMVLSFLIQCCAPDILESSIWYSSKEDLLRERLTLCSRLREEHGVSDETLSTEIAELTRQIAVTELTSIVERSRIFVNTDAIFSRLDDTTRDLVSSLLSIRALRNRDLRRGLRLLGMPDAEGGRVVVVQVDQDVAFFETAFDKYRHGFLYSPEHGLDASLSQRIRHGTLAGELRAVFETAYLSAKRGANGEYLTNEHWLRCLGLSNTPTGSAVDACFRDFAAKLDEEIRLVREEWIQIRAPGKAGGLFNYEFTTEELGAALRELPLTPEHSDVRDLIERILWKRTEECLSEVRRGITDDLGVRLNGLVGKLLSQVEQCITPGARLDLGSLRDAVTQCRTAMNRTLEKIADWFRVEDRREQSSFLFHDLLGSVEQVLNRIGTRCRVTLDLECECSALPGAYFRPFWDMLMILFDNAARHSQLEVAEIQLSVRLSHKLSYVTCRNAMGENCCERALAITADSLNRLSLANQHDLNKLRQEGGTGIAKLHKIAQHDLGRGDHGYGIHFSVAAGPQFVVMIDFGQGFIE
ncbi:MAG: hypothetical protein KJ000_34675 [Pirellulaceae bacterium]|nr:hypothetical protein [Pirellulaceae bacterium]